MEGNTGQKWNWINLYQTVWCIISYHVVTYPANNKLLGGQIYHTRYIVLLYRTCPYIVPYAAVSCLVLPNCHQCAAIECKSSHKIVPYAAISLSVWYIVSGVLRYANNHATTSSPMLVYRMQCATLWAVCQDMLTTMPLHRPLCCYIVCSVLHCERCAKIC